MNTNIVWGIPISVVVLVVVSVAGGLAVYSGVPYAVDRAAGFVDLAAATNNLTETVRDLNQTLALIEPFHGNPTWFFATVHTDFDQVRIQIQTTISAALKVIPLGPESFAYQQALKNIQSDLTTTVEGELNSISATIMWQNFGVWLVIGWTLEVILCILIFMVSDSY